jgi:spermidine synthase
MRRVSLIAVLFVVSGAAGLVDQVCFSKYLSYVVGSTAHAVSAVLAAFMAGMALGARVGGRYAHKIERPLFAYGLLELVVGATVALTPFAFSLLPDVYLWLIQRAPGSPLVIALVRWLLAVLFVIVPTTAMGATLPLLSRLTEGESDASLRERALGVLYASNTLGGAVGSLASVYLLLPALGLSSTTLAAAMASVAVGVVAIAIGRAQTTAVVPTPEPLQLPAEQKLVQTPFALALVAFMSGALVFASEVVFVHLLVLLVGTSAYAFGVILSIFLACLFLGAALAPRVYRRYRIVALPGGLLFAALALALTLPLWPRIPELFPRLGPYVTSFEGRELVRGLAAFTALVLPVTLMGLSFPLLLQTVASRRSSVGSRPSTRWALLPGRSLWGISCCRRSARSARSAWSRGCSP